MDRDKLIIENHNLIYSYAINNKLDIDEYYGILAIALVKAAEKFDQSYGYSFSTFAYKSMKNAVLSERIKRNKDALCHSMTLNGFTEEDVPLVEIIENTDESIFDVRLPKDLNNEEKELLIYRLCGFTNKDIEKLTGMYPAKIAKMMGMIRIKWKQEHEDEKLNR